MKIHVEGKVRLSGHSKRTGNDYDFVQVHFLAPDRGVEGLAAQTISLDPHQYPVESIRVGADYEVEQWNGRIVRFDLVSK